MAIYVNLPDEKEVRRLEAHAAEARRVAAAEHANFSAIKRDLDDPKSKASRNLTANERFDEIAKHRTAATARIAAAMGDPEANRDALGRFAEALDMRGIADRAEFLPLMGGGSESTAHDLRVIARKAMRDEYRDRLAQTKPDDLAAEARRIARDAGHEPHQTDALARLYELDRHLRAQSGPQWTAGKSAAITAFAAVETQWHGRAALVQSIESTARAFDDAEDLRRVIVYGGKPAAETAAHKIAADLIAAGRR